MLAGGGKLALLQHLVDGGLQLLDRGFEAAVLLVGVLGLQFGDDDAGLVQHDVAECQPFRKRLTADDVAERAVVLRAGIGARDGPGDQMLGEHHRRGLQHLDVLVGVLLGRLVLHGEHTEHIAAAQDRYGEERVIDLLARLRPVGEGGMVLCIRLVDRHGELGTAPH